MPLSDREQRILADIEARLRRDDPGFARAVGTATLTRPTRSMARLAVLGFLVGFALLFGIVVDIWIGVLGFALMLASAVWGANAYRQRARTVEEPRVGSQARGGFNRYLDERRGREGDPRL